MPSYAYLAERPRRTRPRTIEKLHTMQTLGVPYTDDGDRARGADDAQAQGAQIAADLATSGVNVPADSEMVALIAYLQRLGVKPAPTTGGSNVSLKRRAMRPQRRSEELTCTRIFSPRARCSHCLSPGCSSSSAVFVFVVLRTMSQTSRPSTRYDAALPPCAVRTPMSADERQEKRRERATVHVYDDDLQEEDNRLPLWWLYTLYGAIAFAAVYWYGEDQLKGVGSAGPGLPAGDDRGPLEEAKKSGGALPPETLIALSKTPATVEDGKQVFTSTCAPCHRAGGGGNIGPNLTDDFWIHGSKPQNIWSTVHDGIPAKGMPTWAPVLGDAKVASVVAYVLSIERDQRSGREAATRRERHVMATVRLPVLQGAGLTGSIPGDGTRPRIVPADVHGRFDRARTGLRAAHRPLGVLPWVHVRGAPAVFLDVGARRSSCSARHSTRRTPGSSSSSSAAWVRARVYDGARRARVVRVGVPADGVPRGRLPPYRAPHRRAPREAPSPRRGADHARRERRGRSPSTRSSSWPRSRSRTSSSRTSSLCHGALAMVA